VLCYLSGRVRGSRRGVEEVAAEVFGLPLSLGSVSNREAEMAGALEKPYRQAQRHVRAAKVKHVDETGWRRAGRWLWTAATQVAALFRIGRARNFRGLQDLLGNDVFGIICSDRHGLYGHLKASRRAARAGPTWGGTSGAGWNAAARPDAWGPMGWRSRTRSSTSGTASESERSTVGGRGSASARCAAGSRPC
jgi:hypothetical protein